MSRRGRPPKRHQNSRVGSNQNGFEAWGGYMAAKKSKLENQFKEEAQHERQNADGQVAEGIFHGVAIYVNGYTDPSSDELKRIMITNGGVFHHYPSSRTTHFIATNLPDVKMKALRGNEVIVSPKWVVDSLESGHLLDYKKYLVYSKQTSSQPKINFPAAAATPNQSKVSSPVPATTTSSDTTTATAVSRGQALDAKSDKFLSEFYNNSRLHLISTMAADFKKYVSDLRSSKPKPWEFPDRSQLKGHHLDTDQDVEKIIAHVDMDCFFVSVSLLKHPELRGFPVAVTHAKGSDSSYSEIASCSYEARDKGVKNGMFLGPALQVCPELRTIPYDFEGYKRVARTLYDTVARYTLQIQAVSCDEMLVDLTEVLIATGIEPSQFAQVLRKEVYSATCCRASVGMGPNALLAKMATKKAKPDGVFCLTSSEAQDYLSSMGVGTLPGVGRKMTKRLQEKFGVELCGDLQAVPLDKLKSEFGAKTGQQLFNSCRGLTSGGDAADDELSFEQERKSVSSEVNYGIRFTNHDECHSFVVQLSEEVCRRLKDISPGLRARTLTLKLMVRADCEKGKETAKFMGHGVCDSHSKSSNFAGGPTNDSQVITKEVLSVLDTFMKSKSVQPDDLRGIGIQLSKFQTNEAGSTGSILNFVKKVDTTATNEPTTSHLCGKDNSAMWKSDEFANIDPTVLDHLPPDIRKEIEEQMKVDSNKRDEAAVGAGCHTVRDAINPYEDLSFSQLDPEFISALPQSMVDELKAELKSKQEASTTSSAKTVFEKMMAASKKTKASPAKVVSSASNSPSFKRAKSPKNSPRFIKKSNNSAAAVSSDAAVSVSKRLPLDDESNETEESEAVILEVQQHPKATLDGFRALEDLKPLYRAWIRGTDSPTGDDMATCRSFLCNVVKENDLDLVYVSLKCIRRLCLEANNANWNQFYNDLVNRLQDVMLQTYGKTLFTRF